MYDCFRLHVDDWNQTIPKSGRKRTGSRVGLEMELSGAALRNAEALNHAPPQALLQVRNLVVRIFPDADRSKATLDDASHEIRPLKGVTFQIERGEIVGLLGESGAGKTTLANALMRLLPSSSRVVEGSIEFEGRPFLALDERELRKMRGAKISLIYQDSAVLNPVLRVGQHLVEVLRAHYSWPRRRYREKAIALLEDMGLPDADRIYAAYPHQLSGGQRQRIVIAQALACQPALIIADEPTASLDPATSLEIIELLGRLQQSFQTAFLLISHDLTPLARLADRIMVMYAGRIIEQGSRGEILEQALHPYTRALLACVLPQDATDGNEDIQRPTDEQRIGQQPAGKRPIPTIAGSPPDLMQPMPGCAFESRCPERMAICSTRFPDEIRQSPTHTVRCFKYGG
jgi:oligopeptide/dipeptide ABC transporter ATP-binding protein